ncbi:Magnesium transporter MgtE [bacterium HR40]|nr:Magnesium transporter MgtE [bacterium HR40]
MSAAEGSGVESNARPLTDELVEEVQSAIAAGDWPRAAELVAGLHAADLADLLQLLEPEQRLALTRALGERLDPETFSYLEEEVREELVEALGVERVAEIVSGLETDDVVDLLSELEAEEQAEILARLPPPERIAVEQQLAYPEDSAGRLMQREFVAVPEYWLVGQTIDYLRATPELPDEFYDIFIVDPRMRPVGGVPVSRVLRSNRSVPLRELRLKEIRPIPATMDQEEVAFLFRQYGLVSAPVVDEDGRLVGVITIDDVVDVMEEEAEEDLLSLGGLHETDVYAPPLKRAKRRIPWLLVNMVTAVAAASVVAMFEDTIARVTTLAVLMPIVAGMGGNAGTQSLTVTVRALATRELGPANAGRMILRELATGALNGLVFLLVGFLLAFLWFGDTQLAIVFGCGMLINLAGAALGGVLVPLVLERLGFDPAVASSIFVTTVTDMLGFFVFLGLATLVLL